MPAGADIVAVLFLFALGASLGSFLNVVVLRWPRIEVPEAVSAVRGWWLQLRGLSHPPSHCPRCGYELRWYDNFPVFGWIWLRGRCRRCRGRISVRYPLVEATTGLLFVGLYGVFFLLSPAWGPPTPRLEQTVQVPPGLVGVTAPGRLPSRAELEGALVEAGLVPGGYVVSDARYVGRGLGGGAIVAAVFRQEARPAEHWPQLAIVLVLAWCLLAASLIDAEHYMIPRWLSYLPALVAVPVHAATAVGGGRVGGGGGWSGGPLDLSVGPVGCAWAVGLGGGLLVSLGLLATGRLTRSFATDVPLLEIEREAAGVDEPTPEERRAEARWVRREMLREAAFVAIPLVLGVLAAMTAVWGPLAGEGGLWQGVAQVGWISAGLGSLLGGLVGAGVIWVIRIAGSLGFGREAMGLGDVDLLFGIGCCLGAGVAALAVFPAAVVALGFAVAHVALRGRHEMPFGPYLAAGAMILLVGYNALADYLAPTLGGVAWLLGPAAPLVGL